MLNLYDTATSQIRPLKQRVPGELSIYLCGPTVYGPPHIGHGRATLVYDILRRYLEWTGVAVRLVSNITDIDDKIIKRAVENGESIRALTNRMVDAMHEDFDALGIARPTAEPRATEFVPQMLHMIGVLEEKGLAYRTPQGDVNYAVRKFPGYGKLSGKSLDELHAGERVAVLDGKEDPLDFVLWKGAKTSEPTDVKWDSKFGPGRPGWHIECSAMACQMLGNSFDIHAGGADLQFPHHENEIAQSEGATGQQFAQYWMHNGFINIDNEKMSKSLGNFFTIRDVLKSFDAETVRFYLIRSHYRTSLNYSDQNLNDARSGLKRLYTALQAAAPSNAQIDWANPYAARFKAAMDEDFGTPEAVAVLFDLAGEVNRSKSVDQAGLLKALGDILGILQNDPIAYLQAGAGLDEVAIQAHIQARADAKAAKNFVEADRIRKHLLEQGIELKDSAAGTTWEAAQ